MRISPAALWHAKALKIDFSLIRGTGPKGYILKSDILQAKHQQQELKPEMDFQLLVPCSLSEELVKKGVNRALSLCSIQSSAAFSFQRIPDFGIQIKLSSANAQTTEKLQKILPLLLQDPRYLLL